MSEEITTIVFDLDGTIYQNTAFHRDYLRFLVEGTARDGWAEALIAFADEVFSGRRLVMNAFYRSCRVEADAPDAFFASLEDALLPEVSYEEALLREDCLYLGDAWAVVTLLGKALCLLDGARSDAVYRKTREKMSLDGMRGNARLREAIRALGGRYRTILLSNSYADTANEFLRQLGFLGVFSETEFSANKPGGMLEALTRRDKSLLRNPERVLAVGDHAFNDLMPLQRLGSRTLWVNPFTGVHEPECDASVHTLDELAGYLEALCRRRQSVS